jgi:hypothetical protein
MTSKKDRKNGDRTRARRGLFTRRRFVKSAGAATVAIGFGTTSISAEELPRVDENDPQAKALNYVHDAGTVDAAKRASTNFCNNCALYAGNESDDWAGCSIFPGKAVAGKGWCSVWAPKVSR